MAQRSGGDAGPAGHLTDGQQLVGAHDEQGKALPRVNSKTTARGARRDCLPLSVCLIPILDSDLVLWALGSAIPRPKGLVDGGADAMCGEVIGRDIAELSEPPASRA